MKARIHLDWTEMATWKVIGVLEHHQLVARDYNFEARLE
jgi:hypothetical protein